MSNVLKDVSLLTAIPEKTLTKLSEMTLYSICENVREDVMENKPISELNFDLFTLYIKHDEDEIKYKVVPSEKMQKYVKETVSKKLNILENTVNNTLEKKILQMYKDIL